MPSGTLLVLLILSLSLDTFAVSVAAGIAPVAPAFRRRFVAACALAEAGMILLGVAIGGMAGRLGHAADWVAALLLLGAGIWTLREGLERGDEVGEAVERAARGGALLAAALAVSLDELAVGVAMGSLRLPIAPLVAAIALQALVASALGLRLGSALGSRAGARATLAAGAALCAVGAWLALASPFGWTN